MRACIRFRVILALGEWGEGGRGKSEKTKEERKNKKKRKNTAGQRAVSGNINFGAAAAATLIKPRAFLGTH